MDKIVPLISSGTAGPLGVLHLPRLWLKVLLGAKGKLPEGYDQCGQGYDQMVLDALGLNRDQVVKFLTEKFPSYPEFEKWILQQKGGKLDPAAVEKANSIVRGYNHQDNVRQSILSSAGIPDTGTIKDAVNLNNIDDWQEFHKSLKSA
jgi:hypothetical protein